MRVERLPALEMLAASPASPSRAAIALDELEDLLQPQVVVSDARVSLQAGRPLEELVADEAAPSLAVVGLGHLHLSAGDFAEVGGDQVILQSAGGDHVFALAELASDFALGVASSRRF